MDRPVNFYPGCLEAVSAIVRLGSAQFSAIMRVLDHLLRINNSVARLIGQPPCTSLQMKKLMRAAHLGSLLRSLCRIIVRSYKIPSISSGRTPLAPRNAQYDERTRS